MTQFHHSQRTLLCTALAAIVLVPLISLKAAEKANGTLTYKGAKKTFTVALKHAYLVKGPDTFEKDKTVSRLVFSTSDFSTAIKETDALNGFDGKLMEGMIVELDGGPRLNYWIVLNDQLVQYSGTVEPAVLKSTANTADHLAGKLRFDDSKAGGPKVDVEFDAPLLKSFSKAR
jgi:hypothetical protein